MARVPWILHPSWISAARDRVESRDVVTCVRLLWLFYPFHVGARDNLWCAKRAYTHLRPAFTGWQMHARHTRQWQTQHSCAGHNAWNGVEDFLFFLLLLFFCFVLCIYIYDGLYCAMFVVVVCVFHPLLALPWHSGIYTGTDTSGSHRPQLISATQKSVSCEMRNNLCQKASGWGG